MCSLQEGAIVGRAVSQRGPERPIRPANSLYCKLYRIPHQLLHLIFFSHFFFLCGGTPSDTSDPVPLLFIKKKGCFWFWRFTEKYRNQMNYSKNCHPRFPMFCVRLKCGLECWPNLSSETGHQTESPRKKRKKVRRRRKREDKKREGSPLKPHAGLMAGLLAGS